MLEHAIFAIDNGNDPQTKARFLRYCDAERALGRMPKLTMLIGSYQGELEFSYMMPSKYLLRVTSFICNQESILLVPGDNRQPCVLHYPENGERVSIGKMREVDQLTALGFEGWTYNPLTCKYYICE